jgi:hypothetical protein
MSRSAGSFEPTSWNIFFVSISKVMTRIGDIVKEKGLRGKRDKLFQIKMPRFLRTSAMKLW